MHTFLKSIVLTAALSVFSLPASAVTLKIATIAPNGTTWMKEFKSAGKEITEENRRASETKVLPWRYYGK